MYLGQASELGFGLGRLYMVTMCTCWLVGSLQWIRRHLISTCENSDASSTPSHFLAPSESLDACHAHASAKRPYKSSGGCRLEVLVYQGGHVTPYTFIIFQRPHILRTELHLAFLLDARKQFDANATCHTICTVRDFEGSFASFVMLVAKLLLR